MLAVLTTAADVERAAAATERTLKQGCVRRRCAVGYQGGGGTFDVFWNAAHGFWSLLSRADNRYWFCFGDHPEPVGPRDGDGLDIVCEINPPLEGINRRCAGAFAQDEAGGVVLTHSGKVGGGRKGIGKFAFLESLRRPEFATVRWPDGIAADMLVIGRVDGVDLPARVAALVRAVRTFKDATAGSE